jgi:2-phospho-L-lactate guanylyltransferase
VVVKKMNVFAIVPVKGLGISKRRLSSVLSPEKRRALTAAMLEDVLNALKSSTVREVLVVSPDSAVRQIADKYGVSYISSRRAGLNPALKEAIEWCVHRNADSVLILPADIPLVSSEDIDKLVALGSEESTVVLSPSLNGGTNALLLNPPNLIPVCFGPNSFFKHVKEAIDRGVAIKFHSSKGIMLDVDSADDLNKMLEIENNIGSKHVLNRLGC